MERHVLAALQVVGDALVSMGVPVEWLRVLARSHPLLVHFPVALLVAAALFAFLPSRFASARAASLPCLALGAGASLLAAASGSLHAVFEPHGRSTELLLGRHALLGWATAAVSLVALAVVVRGRRRRTEEGPWARLGLLAACALLLPAGHLGASLVYGPGYLLEPIRSDGEAQDGAAEEEAADSTSPAVEDPRIGYFRSVVVPIFERHCIRCHGPEKQKGGLRLDRIDESAFDPDLGVLVPGDPEASYLFELITLPPDDPDRMPAKGPPLDRNEIEAIRLWIEMGAPVPPTAP